MTFLLILLNLGLAVLGVRSFDSAIRWLHAHEQPRWESLGSPPGFLWVPVGSSWWQGALARQQFATQFFFGGASWIRASSELGRFRRRYLLCFLGMLLVAALAAATLGA